MPPESLMWFEPGNHPAKDLRLNFRDLVFRRSGVLAPLDLKVSQRAAGANMSVDIAPGSAALDGDEATDQGFYYGASLGITNVTIPAANGSNPRLDRIVAYAQDNQYAGSVDSTTNWLDVVQGTAAASPILPAAPANSISLAQVSVAAGAASITNANVTDLRGLCGLAALPVGMLLSKGYAAATNNIGANPLLLNGSGITIVGLAGRDYRYSSTVRLSTNAAVLNWANIQVYRGSTPVGAPITVPIPPTGTTGGYVIDAIDTPGPGSVVYSVKAEVVSGSGVASCSSSSTCYLEDVGGYAA